LLVLKKRSSRICVCFFKTNNSQYDLVNGMYLIGN
ncbi:plasmid segregation protein ParM, partial [Acinetobacter baumannii]